MQGDLAAGQLEVTKTFRRALQRAGMAENTVNSITQRLSVHLIANPLSTGETSQVNAALLASSDLVDAMDEEILGSVYDDLDLCIATAANANRKISGKAVLFMALWINMSGHPTKLLKWLSGQNPGLPQPVPQPGAVVDGSEMEAYLRATSYYIENPGNIPHLLSSVAAGVALLPDPNQVISAALSIARGAPLAGMASAEAAEDAVAASATLAARHFTYEQATGRMFLTEAGENDLMATGYSGSSAHGGKNNPQAQCEEDIGPIPRGVYKIGKPRKGPTPFSLPLTPDPSNAMCGRSAFLIHGDSIAAPGTASHGCIILARPDRERIAESGVKQLVVVAEL